MCVNINVQLLFFRKLIIVILEYKNILLIYIFHNQANLNFFYKFTSQFCNYCKIIYFIYFHLSFVFRKFLFTFFSKH